MLTRAQIQRIALRSGIGMQAQERDYVQHLLLWLLYARGQTLVFQGGAAIRTVYGGNRYSESLDFGASVGELPLPELQQLWQRTVRGLSDFGVLAEIHNEWQAEATYSFEVIFRGPLFDGGERSQGRVRIGVYGEPGELEAKNELVAVEYDDVRPFVVNVLSAEQLMAEKIRALMTRYKPRDLYDLWLLLGLGIQPEHRLIERRLAGYGMGWHLRRIMDAIETVEAGWERDLRPLLPQYVPYKAARDAVIAWLVGI